MEKVSFFGLFRILFFPKISVFGAQNRVTICRNATGGIGDSIIYYTEVVFVEYGIPNTPYNNMKKNNKNQTLFEIFWEFCKKNLISGFLRFFS